MTRTRILVGLFILIAVGLQYWWNSTRRTPATAAEVSRSGDAAHQDLMQAAKVIAQPAKPTGSASSTADRAASTVAPGGVAVAGSAPYDAALQVVGVLAQRGDPDAESKLRE